jgi:hypothetical protein
MLSIKCLNERLGMLEAEQFFYVLKSQPFDWRAGQSPANKINSLANEEPAACGEVLDYTEWRKTNLCPDMTVNEISDAADAYCKGKPVN